MKQYLRLFFLLMTFLLISAVSVNAQTAPYRVIGYFASWNIYDQGYMVTDIPADLLTHINYAFANVSDEGECLVGDEWADTQFPYPGDDEGDDSLKGNFKQLNLLKEAHPGLQTLISIGGWSWSGKFSDVALTEESRAKFASSCVVMMKQYGFDGLDIDWEYPTGGGLEGNAARPEDKHNFTLLLASLRSALDAQGETDGSHYLLSIAVPAGFSTYENYEMDQIHPYLDWINLMAYDFAGDWSETTGLLASLYPQTGTDTLAGDLTVQSYLAAGVPAAKLNLGVPFYGRGWKGVPDQNNGLNQPYTGTFDDEIHYPTVLSLLSTMQVFRDDQAQAVWLFDPASGDMISFDDPDTLRAKAAYVRDLGLGGMMIWQLGGDDPESTLLTAINAGLHEGDSQ